MTTRRTSPASRATVNPLTTALEETIRGEFVYGVLDDAEVRQWPSINALTKTHNVNPRTLQTRARKGRWLQARIDYRDEQRAQLDVERAKVIAKEGAKGDTMVIRGANAGIARIVDRFEKTERIADEDGDMTSTESRNLATTLQLLHKASKLAQGEANEIREVKGLHDTEIQGIIHGFRIASADPEGGGDTDQRGTKTSPEVEGSQPTD